MSSARLVCAVLAALAPLALANAAAFAPLFAGAALSGWVAAVWIACASLPSSAAPRAAGAWFVPTLALPSLALAVATDLDGASSLDVLLARAGVTLLVVAWLAASSQRAARAPTRYGAAWLVCVAGAPCVVLALELGAGVQAPAWARAWASFSPLAWALDGVAPADGMVGAASLASAWRPLLGAALAGAVAWSGGRVPEVEA